MSSQESFRFTEQSLTIFKAIGNVITNFKDKAKLPAALKDLQAALYPVPLHSKELTAQHYRVSAPTPMLTQRDPQGAWQILRRETALWESDFGKQR